LILSLETGQAHRGARSVQRAVGAQLLVDLAAYLADQAGGLGVEQPLGPGLTQAGTARRLGTSLA
jgi:hypothetical protein